MITVLSTTYVNATTLTAVINIAPDATLGFYDVAVTSGGRKGIGASKFEVTQAMAISGAEIGYGIVADGQTVGRTGAPGAFWTTPPPGWLTLSVVQDGPTRSRTTVRPLLARTGHTSSSQAYLFQRLAGGWQLTILPRAWPGLLPARSPPTRPRALQFSSGESKGRRPPPGN